MTTRFYMPEMSLMGTDCLKELPKEINNLGFTRALIVTDAVLVELGLIQHLTTLLKDANIDYVIYDGTKPNPTVANVNAGLALLQEHICDFVISFGGGSPHDCAKGIALLATNGGDIRDYEGVNKSKFPQLPLIAVNTTAGTASEMTIFSIITDENRHIKMALVDKHMTPIIAVNDASLMIDMPKSLTAATGMDALTHAIEAYVSTAATPITDACAQKAIELISVHLKTAVHDGKNVAARDQMAYAEYLAGMAFNNASLGYVHAMAHQLGGMFDLPHGVCNAVLLPHVQMYNAHVVPERLADVARFMGGNTTELSASEGAQLAIRLIKELSAQVDIPSGLAELGVDRTAFPALAENALKDACGFTNPKQATLEEIISIFESAY
ncbi:MAG: L-threonine dehydrogenase [Culicoidibacterales bacterium]